MKLKLRTILEEIGRGFSTTPPLHIFKQMVTEFPETNSWEVDRLLVKQLEFTNGSIITLSDIITDISKVTFLHIHCEDKENPEDNLSRFSVNFTGLGTPIGNFSQFTVSNVSSSMLPVLTGVAPTGTTGILFVCVGLKN